MKPRGRAGPLEGDRRKFESRLRVAAAVLVVHREFFERFDRSVRLTARQFNPDLSRGLVLTLPLVLASQVTQGAGFKGFRKALGERLPAG